MPHFILKVFRLKACGNVTLCKFTVHSTSQYSATFYFHGVQTESLWECNSVQIHCAFHQSIECHILFSWCSDRKLVGTQLCANSLCIPPVNTVPHFFFMVFRQKACGNVTLCNSLCILPVNTVPQFIFMAVRLKACGNVTMGGGAETVRVQCTTLNSPHFPSSLCIPHSAVFYFHGGQTESLWECNSGSQN